jgi:hypothetical protein
VLSTLHDAKPPHFSFDDMRLVASSHACRPVALSVTFLDPQTYKNRCIDGS